MAVVVNSQLGNEIYEKTAENVFLCYQCGKCTAGCPVAEEMDLKPNQVIRALQYGLKEDVLTSKTIWLCASCETCTTRCPQGIDIAHLMDFLREKSLHDGIRPALSVVPIFNQVALKGIERYGRLYELGSIIGFNLKSRQPLKDFDVGLKLIRKGKIKFLPERAKYPADLNKIIQEPERNTKRIAYYSGCSLHSVGEEFNLSTMAVFRKLGLELVEPENWVCCGSTPAHATDYLEATVLPVKNLALIEKTGLKHLMLPCALCFLRFRRAVYDLESDPVLQKQVQDQLGFDYAGQIKIHHLNEALIERVGLEKIKEQTTRSLENLKVVCYYGCLLTRPPKITGAEHPEYPVNMDLLMEAVGAETLDWSYKAECCGAALSVTQTKIALRLIQDILTNAREVGAEAIIVACPMCHANLDTRQLQLAGGSKENLPVFYLPQLLGLALGLDLKELALARHLVDPMPLLREKGFI